SRDSTSGPPIRIESASLSPDIVTAIESLELNHKQKTNLAQVVQRWFDHLHRGTIDSFKDFRRPDSLQFNRAQLKFLATRSAMTLEELETAPEGHKLKLAANYATRCRFDVVLPASIRFAAFARQDAISGIDAANYYPGGYLLLHASSPARYRIGPREVRK